jgi:hypothetical protein
VKIVAVSNADRDSVDDLLVADNVRSHSQAVVMADALNKTFCKDPNSLYFFTVKPNEYKLKVWQP